MVTLRQTRIPRLLLGAAILTAAMAGCSHNAADDESGAAASARAEVTLTRVARADISQVVTLTGTAGLR